jgi:hypothetical protein
MTNDDSASDRCAARVDAVLTQRPGLRGPQASGDFFAGLLSDHPLLKADPRRFFGPRYAPWRAEPPGSAPGRTAPCNRPGSPGARSPLALGDGEVSGFHLIIMPPAVGLLPEFKGASMSRSDPFDLRNAGTWPEKMQSLSKHGCFAYLENLGSSGPTVAARIDAEWQVSPPPTGTASPR